MMPAPQTNAADLCNTLLHLMQDDVELCPFERQKYAIQAEKLKRADPTGREAALMLLAVLNDKSAACVEHGERLLELRGLEADYVNYSSALFYLGQMEQRFSVLRRGVKKFPQSAVLLDQLIYAAMTLEDVAVLEKSLEQFEDLTKAPHILVIDAALQEMDEKKALQILTELIAHFPKENTPALLPGDLRRMRKLADEIES